MSRRKGRGLKSHLHNLRTNARTYFLRYQMTHMNIKKERTKICITNLDQISRELKLPNKDPIIAYISKRLSIKIKVNKINIHGENGDLVILSGNIDIQTIRDTLYRFIEVFVLCSKCKLPELEYQNKDLSLNTY